MKIDLEDIGASIFAVGVLIMLAVIGFMFLGGICFIIATIIISFNQVAFESGSLFKIGLMIIFDIVAVLLIVGGVLNLIGKVINSKKEIKETI